MTDDKGFIGLAVYIREQWNEFLSIAEDRHDLEDTWEEWNEALSRIKEDLRVLGVNYVEVVVDMKELTAFCRKRNMPNNADTRSFFVTEKLGEM